MRSPRNIVVTGAAGQVGTAIRPLLRAHYHLTLFDRVAIGDVSENETAAQGDINDVAALDAAFSGADGIIHLAGCSTDSDFAEQVTGNVEGVWNVFQAARKAGVERVVFASTHHVVGHYPRHRRLGADAIIRPDSRYGLCKAFGEHVGAFCADQHGARVLCIRIGFYGEKPIDRRRLSIWTSGRDLAQLIRIGLDHPDLRYAIVYGVSNNARGFFDNSVAYSLGYRPQDSADAFTQEVMASVPPEDPAKISSHVIGGFMADTSFTGSISRVDEW